jgi:signal transduction histidine kinase
MAPNLDLKSSLTLRVVAVALFCFLIAAALALFGTYRDVRQLNEHVADVLVRQLQMQLSRIETSMAARFPDLDPVTEVLQSAGQCVEYAKSDGSIARMAMIRSLRTTLRNLRPPEIDDFGLATSLATLARDQERLANGQFENLASDG